MTQLPKINVVLRTCDTTSLTSTRIVPKDECVVRCLRSLTISLDRAGIDYSLHIIDDRSTDTTREKIAKVATNATFDFLGYRNDSNLSPKQKSRFSVKKAYDYALSLPKGELVYFVEDDYLHFPDTIFQMVTAYQHFKSLIPVKHVGIFPQDFNQLCWAVNNPFNDTYVKPCVVVAGPDRYYRTTWFTHESFMISTDLLHERKGDFESLLYIGSNEGYWEGNTISNIWCSADVAMLMPLRTLAIHVSDARDLPLYDNSFDQLWQDNEITGL